MTEQEKKEQQEALFKGLKDAVEELQVKESVAREPLEAAFNTFCEPANAIFDKATAAEQEVVRNRLLPKRKELDAHLNKIRLELQAKVDKAVKEFSSFQKKVEQDFYSKKTVQAAVAVKEAAIAEERAKFEAACKVLADATDVEIKKLQALYNEEAKKLDEL